MKYHFTLKSENQKIGPIPASTSSRLSCPDSCPLKGNGCYVVGPIGWHWDAVTRWERGDDFEQFLEKIRDLPDGQLWRHNQAGDLPGENLKISAQLLIDLVNANEGKRGFTYTHKPVLDSQDGPVEENRSAIAESNRRGFTINLSANGLKHADELAALGIGPVATILPDGVTENTLTSNGRKVVVCPAQKMDGMTCSKCKLCSRADRSAIVGFIPHGTAKKKAANVARANS